MRTFLIASHGRFASGIKTSLDIIIGEQENILVLDAYAEGNENLSEKLEELFAALAPETELVVFTDLMGGSVTNQMLQAANGRDFQLVAGMNLPLLIEVILADPDAPIEKTIEEAVARAKEQLVYVSQMIKQTNHD